MSVSSTISLPHRPPPPTLLTRICTPPHSRSTTSITRISGVRFEKIGSDGEQLHAVDLELGHRRIEALLRARADGDVAAFLGEAAWPSPALCRTAARHQRELPGKPEIHLGPCRYLGLP